MRPYFGLPSDPHSWASVCCSPAPFCPLGMPLWRLPRCALRSLTTKGKTVGWSFAPGRIFCWRRKTTQVSTFRRAEEVLEALRRGEVETAFVWGPMAGYYNTQLGSAYQIIPVAGPGLQWQVAIGVKPKRSTQGGPGA